jgi:hypothetical protein
MYQYIQDSIKNNSRAILKGCSRPQVKAVQEIVRGLFVENEPILRHLAQNQQISAKKQGEKYSYHLCNVELKVRVEEFSLRKAQTSVRKDTIIAYDLTDLAKPCAEKMAGLSRVWDGSEKRISTGYFLHGVGINNLLVRLEKHDNNSKTLNQVRKEIIGNISNKLHKQGVWVFDRGNDDKQFFKYLEHEAELRFIARLKANRQVVLKKTGDLIKVKDLDLGTHEIYLLDKNNCKADTRSSFTLVKNQHLEHKKPILLIHNLKEAYAETKIVTMYLERWGIENLFKKAKDNFKLDRIRVLNTASVVNLITLIQFVINVATITFLKLQQITTQLVSGVLFVYKRFIKLKVLGFNVCSFLSFIKISLPPLIHRKIPPANQPSLFSDYQLEKLGSI